MVACRVSGLTSTGLAIQLLPQYSALLWIDLTCYKHCSQAWERPHRSRVLLLPYGNRSLPPKDQASGCQSAVFQGEGCGAGPLGQRLQGPHTPVALELALSLLLASSIPLHQELTGVKLAECHWPHSGHPPHQ